MIAASVAAAVKPPQLSIFSPGQIAAITGPPVWSKGVLDAVAATTARQNSILEGVLAAAGGPKLSILSSVRLFESNWVSSYTSPLSSLVQQAGSLACSRPSTSVRWPA